MMYHEPKSNLPAFVCLWLLAVSVPTAHAQPQTVSDLQTTAEASDFKSTSSYEEVMSFCRELDQRSERVHLVVFGKSFEGRELPLLVVTDPPVSTPAKLDRSKLTVLMMANIHAGEVCGKEAGLMLARELAAGQIGVLDRVNVLIAPIYNADGNERVSKDNRPGQIGPENGMGQRHNAQDLDLNRDHMKLKSPECRAFAGLLNAWDPEIVIDTHTTNGSHHRYALTYDSPRNPAAPPEVVAYVRDAFLPEVSQRMLNDSGYRSFVYGDFDPPHKKWVTYPDWPRYNTQYVGLRGRIGILSEAYAYIPFRDRVLATKAFLGSCLQQAAESRQPILSLLASVRRRIESGSRDVVPIASVLVPRAKKLEVLGYVEEQGTDGRSKATDVEKTYTNVLAVNESQATAAVTRPFAYLIPPQHPSVIDNLLAHGVQVHELREQLQLTVEQYRVSRIHREQEPYQGQEMLSVHVEPESAAVELMPGQFVIKTAQPLSQLIVNLLEPAAQDGLTTWNYFDDALRENGIFPVQRLLQATPLLTSPVLQTPESSSEAIKTVTPELLYGDAPPNFDGSFPDPGSIRWLSDETYMQAREDNWYQIDAKSGRAELLFDGNRIRAALSEALDENPGVAKQLWRQIQPGATEDASVAIVEHRGDLYQVDLEQARVQRLTWSGADEELGELSPDGKWVAYVRDFNLFSRPASEGDERRLTRGGTRWKRFGKADWVYFEEVYDRSWRGFQFSPDSKQIALMEFNDSPVSQYRVIDPMTPRSIVETERYPKAGDPIPRVRLGIVPVAGGPLEWVELPDYSPDNLIITRFGWLPDASGLYLLLQDRAQQWMDFVRYDLKSHDLQQVCRERSEYWVGDPGPVHFLKDGSWIVRSDRDGWRHIYRISADGKTQAAVTQGPWEVTQILSVDEPGGWIYFLATKDSHLASNLYRARIDSRQLERLTLEAGSHRVRISPGHKLFVDVASHLRSPAKAKLRSVDGTWHRVLDSNPVRDLTRYRLSPIEYLEVPISADFRMPCTMVKPLDFDLQKKYPVWIMTYGGPHFPSVSDSWSGYRVAFDQMLAGMGIIAFRCDPRSASGRGAKSAWTAYRQLGVVEAQDLERLADWLADQPYIDAERLGLSGYSYGGFLTAYTLTHSKKFAAGIAGGPVTDWRNYDAFYTERYMNTPQENPDGYAASSVVAAAAQLHGQLLLIHGGMDDNVHLQNTLQLAQKLQQADIPFEMMIYPTSRHGIHSPHYNRVFLDFIRRTMLHEDGER